MNTVDRVRLCLALLLAAVVLTAGCSDDEPAPPTDANRTPEATPAWTPAGTPTPTGAAAPQETPTPAVEASPTPAGDRVASTASIPTEDLPRVRFVTPDGAEAMLPIEVPPADEYRIGLSGRHELDGRGMLFYYPSGDHTGGFWMRDTFIDLDIAFVSVDLEVIDVLQMQAETQEIHSPGRPYLAAIEAPAGWFEAHGIDAGARVEFLFDVEEHLR